MTEQMIPPGGHTALSDPESVLLELVDESRHRKGMTEAEAYAFLAGADRNTSELPPLVASRASHYDPTQPRSDATGRWTKVGSSADFPELTHSEASGMQLRMKTLDGKQRGVILEYTSEGYKRINGVMRTLGGILAKSSASVKLLRSAMSPLSQNVRVFRTTNVDNFGVKSLTELEKLVGRKFVDRGFTSTSIKKNVGMVNTKVAVLIDVPKGTPAVYVETVSRNQGEFEMILDAGTKFRVDSVEVSGDQARVRLSVVN